MDLLEQVISRRPEFHASETEIERSFAPNESLLDRAQAERLAASGLTCYAIGDDVLRFLGQSVGEYSRTLETGAGCSTLVFALRRAKHTAITPSIQEIERIRAFAEKIGIGLDTVVFVAEPSERYLPSCRAQNLDFVLLDGKHAFPWPMIDWFYTADRIRKGGLLLLDDAQLRSVAVLIEFLSSDPGWSLIQNFSGKTVAFRKTRDQVLDVAWHMQPWTAAPFNVKPRRSFLGRIKRRLGKLVR